MSKNKKYKQKMVEQGIEQMDAEQQRIQQDLVREKLNDSKEIARPNLIKRVGAGMLDFVFGILLTFGLYIISYFTIFPSIGYNTATEKMLFIYTESGLYENVDGDIKQLTATYNADEDTLENHFDKPIYTFYSTNERAITDNKLEEYNESRLNSSFYKQVEDEIVLKTGIDEDDLKSFLTTEYSKALKYLFADPEIISANNTVVNTVGLSLLFCVAISSAIFYVAVPMMDKKNRTLAYMIFKIMPVDIQTLKLTNKKTILLRNVVFCTICYISSITMYFWLWSPLAFLPIFFNTILLTVTKQNTGFGELISKTMVINESYSSSFETLKQITNQGGN